MFGIFGTLWTIAGVLMNFWTLALVATLLAGSAAVYFIPPPVGGPAKLIKFWLTPSTWLGILGAFAIIYAVNSVKVIQEQKQEIHQGEVQKTTSDDGKAVLTDNVKKKEETGKVNTRIRHAIDTAKPGDEEDEVLDQIAREQCSLAANHVRPDCLRQHK